MWIHVILIGLFGLLWTAGLCLAGKLGSKKAQLEALREEIKRQAREQEQLNAAYNRVSYMSDDAVAQRLQDISSKQR